MRRITSLAHPVVKHMRRLQRSSSYRESTSRLLIEGSRVISEFSGSIKRLFVAEGRSTPSVQAEEIYICDQLIMQKVSALVSPEGLIAEVERPKWASLQRANRVLALDAVGDPGNMGTLIRTALAFGWDGIYLLEGCCDPYNDKAIRAAMGATFRIPLGRGSWVDLQRLAQKNCWSTFAGDLSGIPLEEVDYKGGCLLVLGSESKGVSPAAKKSCTAITIPIASIESLNVAVAGAILLYFLGKGNG